MDCLALGIQFATKVFFAAGVFWHFSGTESSLPVMPGDDFCVFITKIDTFVRLPPRTAAGTIFWAGFGHGVGTSMMAGPIRLC